MDRNWRDDGLCQETDPEIFFPGNGGSAREAKKICARCDVKEDCRAWTLETSPEHGVWAGLSARDRRKLTPKVTA